MLNKLHREILQHIADGHKLWRAHVPRTGEEIWNLDPTPGVHVRIPTPTVRALEKRKLIEPTGLLYWRLTAAGRAAIAKEPAA